MQSKTLMTYLDIQGMFEVKRGPDYYIFNQTNKNFLTWKAYPKRLQLNTAGMFEIKFNLSDVTFQGTGDT
jgi:hypothetical protein